MNANISSLILVKWWRSLYIHLEMLERSVWYQKYQHQAGNVPAKFPTKRKSFPPKTSDPAERAGLTPLNRVKTQSSGGNHNIFPHFSSQEDPSFSWTLRQTHSVVLYRFLCEVYTWKITKQSPNVNTRRWFFQNWLKNCFIRSPQNLTRLHYYNALKIPVYFQ